MATIRKKVGAAFCALALILWCIAGAVMMLSAKAADIGSLTLWCVKDEDVVVNMHWQIYRVGSRVKDDYVFEGDFAGYRATLGDKTKPMLEWDTDTVAAAGEALKYKTIVDQISNRGEGTTDAQGTLTFSGLEDGLYLVWGDVLKVGSITYIPSAIFFEVNGEEENVLNAYPKIVLHTLSEDDVNYSVRKVWQNDENQPWDRSVSIVVERYRDNQYYDQLTLSAENDWTFSWEDSAEHFWFVYEKEIPDHYTVAYQDNHKQYLIVNTYDTTTDDSSMTDTQTTATTDDFWTDINTTTSKSTDQTETETTPINTTAENQSETSVTSVNTEASDTKDTNLFTSTRTTTNTQTTTVHTTTDESAPQTGQLWWPVPGMAFGGLVLLGMGLMITKKDDDE